ncbi:MULTISPECIES: amidohydrolase [unclassified Massilia]|uniref:amidohydrolase n=1 Tax=unclassified Massilia TaxID=2609279 RepID=UPI001780825F|nr:MULTISPECIES: amidohydrolase [unclassified Massilia]MBD8530366.1 amidohydrolase [Massilia sp. CFBP 13647]MBD8673143.1 amidohydrolase [Massilia sp. CFBP 13721]
MKPTSRLLKYLLLATAVSSTFAGAAHAAAALPPEFTAQLDKDFPAIEALYQDLHRNPELAFQEHQTAKKLAERVKALGFEVTTGVGGTGVVAILKNGPGPIAMLRTEIDALPVLEKTGLPFASTATAKNAAGETVPTMHACGHDVHMSAWYATAKLMAENRKAWSGTLMLVGQPAEEPLTGSAAMLKDGLFTRFPKPDYAISLHDEGTLPAGQLGWHAGHFRASADTVTITLHGQGGHGATPQETRDPVVMSARVVLALQTLISRENNPADPVVITVGSIHGGTQANIVPDQVKLQLTVRTFRPEVRKRVLASIVREVEGEAMAAGMPKKPQVDIVPGADSVYNDPELTARAVTAVQGALGAKNVVEMPAKMTSEDFANYGQAGVKAVLLHVGAVEPKKLADARAAGKYPPGTHSPQWAPDFKPTVRSFITAETAILLDLLKPGQKK